MTEIRKMRRFNVQIDAFTVQRNLDNVCKKIGAYSFVAPTTCGAEYHPPLHLAKTVASCRAVCVQQLAN